MALQRGCGSSDILIVHLKITPIYIYPQLHHHFFSSSSSSSLQLFFSFFSSPYSLLFFILITITAHLVILSLPCIYLYPILILTTIAGCPSPPSHPSLPPLQPHLHLSLSLCIYNLRHARRPNAPANIAFAFSLYRCSLLLASANNNTSNNSATSRRYAHQNRLPTKALPSNLLAPENFWPFDNWSLSFAGCCFSYRQ